MRVNNIEYFHYYKMTIYLLKNFDTFITLIEKGIIRVSFKINVFLSGPKKGKICDHGTSFDIRECDLHKLYTIYDNDFIANQWPFRLDVYNYEQFTWTVV